MEDLEDYRKQVAAAVRAVRQEEPKIAPFSDEDALKRIEWWLAENFLRSLRGTGTTPVPNTLSRLRQWASNEDLLKALKEMRYRDVKREHEDKK